MHATLLIRIEQNKTDICKVNTAWPLESHESQPRDTWLRMHVATVEVPKPYLGNKVNVKLIVISEDKHYS